MNKLSTEIFLSYLENSNFEKYNSSGFQLSTSILQKLLWIADFFQLEMLQESVIRDLIIPRVDIENCLILINEAYKKLKICEDSNDYWYSLLNTCLNKAGKNLIPLYKQNYFENIKVNTKIMEEIIERHIKLEKNSQNVNFKEIIEILFKLKNVDDLTELIFLFRKESSRKISKV